MPTLAAAQPCLARQASVVPQRRPRHAVPDRGAGAPSRAALFLPKRLELAPEPGLGRGVLRRLVAGAVTTSRSGSDGRPPLLALPLCSGAGVRPIAFPYHRRRRAGLLGTAPVAPGATGIVPACRHHAPDPRRGGKEFVAVESSLADSAARFSHGLDQAAKGAIPAGLPGGTIHNETGA